MRRVLVAAITLAATAALVSAASVTAAQASQHGAAQHGAAQHGAAQHGAAQRRRARQEQFRIISITPASRRQSVLATGAFTAGGYEVPGRVSGLRATDKMVFRGGTFLVGRHITSQWLPLPTSACLIRETIRGSYYLHHGTGAYRGISGSGGFTLRITGVIRRAHGKCGGPMTVFQQITSASGGVRR
jgi:hypothetical protein